MERSVSTISEELKRNEVAGTYTPAKAQAKATVRRKAAKYQGMRIVDHPALRDFVEAELSLGQSPSALAGRLTTGREGLPTVSKDGIYRFIASPYGRAIEYQRAVLRRQTKAKKRVPKSERLKGRTFIDARPMVITQRLRVGDLEADFIVSGKTGSGYLLTAVTIVGVEQAFLDVQRHFPELASLTLDNDILFRLHKRLSTLLGVPIYFTEPYSSWQKGSIENYNKQVRKYIPNGADISRYSSDELQVVQGRLNERFMKVLGYKTPCESLNEYRKTAEKETLR